MTPEQQKAIALARARRRRQEAEASEKPERGFGQALYDNIVGDPNDGVTSYGESLGTWLNRAGESMTLGVVGDEASAAATGLLPGRSYDGELERYRQNEEDMSLPSKIAADIGGAVLPAFLSGGATAAPGLLGQVSSAASKIAPTNMAARYIGGGKGLMGTLTRGGISGALMGATQGFSDGEGGVSKRFENAKSAATIGGGVGLAAAGIGSAVGKAAQGRAERRIVKNAAKLGPSTDELRATGNALYKQVDDAGVQIRPEAFDRMRADALERLRANTGFDELPGSGSITPNASRVMEIMQQSSGRMSQEPTAALPFRSLDQMRRQAGAAAGNVTNKTDQAAGMEIIGALDDFVARLGPDDVVTGKVRDLQSAIVKAREVWGQMSRSQTIDDAIEAGGDYLGGSASGIRNQFKNLLRNPKRIRGFSDAEKTAMRQVVNGGPLQQLVNLAGGGMAQLGSVAAGWGAGGLPGAMGGAALAAGQRKLSETIAQKSAETARAAIASGKLRGPQAVGLLEAITRPKTVGTSGVMGILPLITDAQRSR